MAIVNIESRNDLHIASRLCRSGEYWADVPEPQVTCLEQNDLQQFNFHLFMQVFIEKQFFFG